MEQSVFNEQNINEFVPQYVVLRMKCSDESFLSGVSHLTELENAINAQAQKGYRLHTISTEINETTGRRTFIKTIATMVFEKVN